MNITKSDNRIKAVIFDLDGTLADTEKFYQIAWPEAVAHFGYKMEPWQALAVRSLGRPFAEQSFKEWFGEEFPYWDVRGYRKDLIAKMLKENGIPLKPGAIELLEYLKKEKITIALTTANDLQRATAKLEMAGILEYFDHIICAEMVKQGKPAPDIYRYACEELGLKPEQTFAVEDSPNGVKSAYGAGCKVIMVPDLSEPDEELEKMLFACCRTLTDIEDLL